MISPQTMGEKLYHPYLPGTVAVKTIHLKRTAEPGNHNPDDVLRHRAQKTSLLQY
jgi:hypothetical protein